MNIGEKIKEERNKKGMTQEQLADAIGLKNYQTVSAIENGQRVLKAEEVPKIANALGITISDLYGEEKKLMNEILWDASTDKTPPRKIEERIINLCQNYKKLTELINYEYEKFIPTTLEELQEKKSIGYYVFGELLARDWRNLLDLGTYPANNLIHALQKRNILIFRTNLKDFADTVSILGTFGAAIVLNKNKSPCWDYFNIARELYFLITWNITEKKRIHNQISWKRVKKEWQADKFATALLLPEESVRDEFFSLLGGRERTLMDFIELAARYKVPIELLPQSRETLIIFPRFPFRDRKDDHKNYRNIIENHPKKDELSGFMRTRESELPELPEIYVSKALKSYQLERISQDELSEYFEVAPEEIDDFLGKYGYPGMKGVKLEDLAF